MRLPFDYEYKGVDKI
jgi:hypothetical protein